MEIPGFAEIIHRCIRNVKQIMPRSNIYAYITKIKAFCMKLILKIRIPVYSGWRYRDSQVMPLVYPDLEQ